MIAHPPRRLIAAASGLCLASPLTACGTAPRQPPPRGITYYVSRAGSNANSGRSPRRAWRTVARVNRASLQPGDEVRFAGHETFSDHPLTPRRSGRRDAPIVYGSYGDGRATLTDGIVLPGSVWLVLEDLALSRASQGILASATGAGSSHIAIRRMTIHDVSLGINSANRADHDWTIEANSIADTGDSGLLLLGDRFRVVGNTIVRTGTDRSISYGKHGVYLKAANSTVSYNTIRNFSADGISVRYRNSIIEHNTISNGPIGIAWFQYDTIAGTSYWRYNNITATTDAGIYVSPSDIGGNTRESFVITGNSLSKSGGVYTNLQPTSGTDTVSGNRLG